MASGDVSPLKLQNINRKKQARPVMREIKVRTSPVASSLRSASSVGRGKAMGFCAGEGGRCSAGTSGRASPLPAPQPQPACAARSECPAPRGLPLLQPPRHSPFTNFITSVPSLRGGTVPLGPAPDGAEPGTLARPGAGGDLPAAGLSCINRGVSAGRIRLTLQKGSNSHRLPQPAAMVVPGDRGWGCRASKRQENPIAGGWERSVTPAPAPRAGCPRWLLGCHPIPCPRAAPPVSLCPHAVLHFSRE